MPAELAAGTRPERAPGTPRVAFAGIGDEAGDTLDEQLRALEQLGWSTIELRTLDGCALAALDERSFARVADELGGRDVEVVAVASQLGGWDRPITRDVAHDVAELTVLADRCQRLGTRLVRVMSFLDGGLDEDAWGRRAIARLGELARRAQDAGLVLVHENCTGWAARSAERMLRMLDEVASPGLGLLFDTGNGIEYGYDAVDLLEPIAERVEHVHVKDAVATPAGARYVAPGSGDVDVAGCLTRLLAAGYAGAWSLEPHVDLRPHEGAGATCDVAPRGDRFVACGRALERLVDDAVLPAAPAWRRQPGSIVGGRGA